jgi:DNA end-binding protein Ku
MPRSVWTGSLAFGLVTIPVRLFPATEPKDVRFHLVDERGRRVRYRRFVEETGDDDGAFATWSGGGEAEGADATEERLADRTRDATTGQVPPPSEDDDDREVAYEDLKRGYETAGGMVVFDPDELEAVRPERSRVIDIEDFVRLDDVDPVFFEKSYVLAPGFGAEKPYALLLRALERAGRVGIGRFVLRTKPHLVAIRPMDGALGLETLFFGDEVRDPRALVPSVDDVEVSERELDLAERLIEMLHTDWEPAAYADTYRDELLRRIADKEPLPIEEEVGGLAPGAGGRVEELMDALKASVEQAKQRSKRTSKQRSA